MTVNNKGILRLYFMPKKLLTSFTHKEVLSQIVFYNLVFTIFLKYAVMILLA